MCVCCLVTNENLCQPNFHKNILSIGQFVREGNFEVGIHKDKMVLTRTSDRASLNFHSDGNSVLYYMKGKRETVGDMENAMTTVIPEGKKMDINEAHDKFGHICEDALRA